MDIQARKIAFVQEFLNLQNEELLSHFEDLLRSNNLKNKEHKTMTIKELNNRIDNSLNDSDNNKLTTAKDLISEIETWD